MAVIALITWWSCNAFLPVFATGLAQTEAALRGLDKSTTLHLVEDWKFTATMVFNIGGLLGTLLTIPAAKQLGRKPMFAIYFAVATFSIFITFGAPLPPQMRLYSYFLIGLSVDRKSDVEGKGVSVRVDLGGRSVIKKKTNH